MKQILKTVSKYEFHRPPVESPLTQQALCTLNICKQLELKSRYDEQHIFADFICATNAPIIPTKLKDLKIAIEESMRLRNLEDLNMI